MNVDIAVAVCFTDVGGTNVAEPIIGGNLAGNVQNQTAVGVSLVGVFINAQSSFSRYSLMELSTSTITLWSALHTIALVAIQDISLGGGKIVGGN